MDDAPALSPIKSYVLRSGRMSEAQKRAYDSLHSRYGIVYRPGPAPALDYRKIFGNDKPVTMEIGFGMGAATAQIAGANPGKNYLGVEVFRAGVGKLLWEIEQRGLANIRIIEHDAVETLRDMIGDNTVAAFHIFFPDPWPKKKHHKRRLLTRPFTDLLARKLAPGGCLYMVTDWEDYAAWALGELSATPGLANPWGGFAPRQPWRPQTKFERKGLDKQHQVWELYFIKLEK
ncbi:MAG: tRNA (guanosine(46)-N7)-methyltransferase TrmB [Treponema sp.]|jgi:tRNA (guanine-N7-)-methyltransferase|nr:tRNA (guanosine(46)-N7)-methyltransferase TrmB [Treponema sp.]